MLVALLEELHEARHLAQGLLEIMGGDVGELLQLLVRTLEIAVPVIEVGACRRHLVELADDAQAHGFDVAPHAADLRGTFDGDRMGELATGDPTHGRTEPGERVDHPFPQRPLEGEAGRHQEHESDDECDDQFGRGIGEGGTGGRPLGRQCRVQDGEPGPHLVEARLAGTEQLLLDPERVTGLGGQDGRDGEGRVPGVTRRVGPEGERQQVRACAQVGREAAGRDLLVVDPREVGLEERGVPTEDEAADPGLLVEVCREELVGGQARRIDLRQQDTAGVRKVDDAEGGHGGHRPDEHGAQDEQGREPPSEAHGPVSTRVGSRAARPVLRRGSTRHGSAGARFVRITRATSSARGSPFASSAASTNASASRRGVVGPACLAARARPTESKRSVPSLS